MNFTYLKYNYIKKIKKKKIRYDTSEKLRIFIYQLPIYGNIGDQAIAYSMIKFLKDYYSDYEIIENRVSYPCFDKIENLNPGDKICLVGGGNFGDLYPYEMWYRNHIIKNHPNNQIVIFPVSIYYNNKLNSKYDNKYYDNSNVYLMLREQKSYEYAMNNFKCNLILVPDIVNYLKLDISKDTNNNSVCILKRNDVETRIKSDELLERLNAMNINYKMQDNHVSDRIFNSETMNSIVESQLANISSYDLIITDRLHGMIFAYITDTPAIVLPANVKILESYKLWYKNNVGIHYLNSIEELDVNLINKMTNKVYNESLFDENTINTILEFINE